MDNDFGIFGDLLRGGSSQGAPASGGANGGRSGLSGIAGFLGSPMGQGLLAAGLGAAASSGRGRGLLGNVGQGGIIGMQAYSGAQERIDREAQEAQLRQVRALTLQKGGLELDQLRRQAEDDQAGRAVLRRFGAGGAGTAGRPSADVNAALPAEFQIPVGTLPQHPPNGAGQPVPNQGASARYLQIAEEMAREGLTKQAEHYYGLAEKFRPKYNTTAQVVRDPRTNQLVQVVLNDDGGYQVLPFGVKPDMRIEDLGDRKIIIDQNVQRDGQTWGKTMTPDARASNAVAQENARIARERLNHDRSQVGKPQFYDGAWFTPPSATNPQGSVVQPQMPAGAMDLKLTEVQGNASQFATRMLDATRTMEKLTADGNGPAPSTVARAGYTPEFPQWVPGGQIAAAGLGALNRQLTPEKALQVRQAQDNWLTANLRKESGAAIPPHELEQERIKWFPQPGEGEETAKQKEAARRVAQQAMLTQAGPGAKLVQRNLDRADAETAERSKSKQVKGGAIPLPSMKPSELKHGQVYELPNGKTGKWDSLKRGFTVN